MNNFTKRIFPLLIFTSLWCIGSSSLFAKNIPEKEDTPSIEPLNQQMTTYSGMSASYLGANFFAPLFHGLGYREVGLELDSLPLTHALSVHFRPTHWMSIPLNDTNIIFNPGHQSSVETSQSAGLLQLSLAPKPYDPWHAYAGHFQGLSIAQTNPVGLLTQAHAEGHLRAWGARVAGNFATHADSYSGDGSYQSSRFIQGFIDNQISYRFSKQSQIRLSYRLMRYENTRFNDQRDIPDAATRQMDEARIAYQNENTKAHWNLQFALTRYATFATLGRGIAAQTNKAFISDDENIVLAGLIKSRYQLGNHQLNALLRSQHNFISSESGYLRGRFLDDAKEHRFIFGLSDSLSLLDRRLKIELGIAGLLNLYHLPEEDNTQNRDLAGLNAKLQIDYQIKDGISAFLAAKRNTQLPNTADLTLYGPSELYPSYQFTPNLDLGAQKTHGVNLGLSLDILGNFNASISGFFNRQDDALILVAETNSREITTINRPDSLYSFGGTLQLDATINPHFSSYGFITLTGYSKDAKADELFVQTPLLFGKIGLRYRKKIFSSDLHAYYGSAKSRLSELQARSELFINLNFHAALALSKVVSFQLKVENMLNQTYRFISRYDHPGINARLGLSIKL